MNCVSVHCGPADKHVNCVSVHCGPADKYVNCVSVHCGPADKYVNCVSVHCGPADKYVKANIGRRELSFGESYIFRLLYNVPRLNNKKLIRPISIIHR